MRVAVLGTGLMGAPMARRLAGAGHGVTVWNRSAARAAPLADCCTVAATPAEAVAGAEAVICMLMDDAATGAVLYGAGALAAMAEGALLLDMGSLTPAFDRDLAARAAPRVAAVDAPVSGGVVAAEAGTLSIFAGGTADAVARAAPVFVPLGRATHVGPSGAGQAVKLANQLIVAATIGAVAEALHLARAAGCDPATVQAALRGGFAESRILELHGARMVAGDTAPGGRSAAQLKDLDNAAAEAAALGLDLPMLGTARAGFADMVARGMADLDHSAYYQWLSRRS